MNRRSLYFTQIFPNAIQSCTQLRVEAPVQRLNLVCHKLHGRVQNSFFGLGVNRHYRRAFSVHRPITGTALMDHQRYRFKLILHHRTLPPTTTTNMSTLQEAFDARLKYTHFRILVIGRANAGKTTLLKRVCNTDEEPCLYDEENNNLVSTSSLSVGDFSSHIRHSRWIQPKK